MKRTAFEGFMLLLVLIGGTLAWQTGRERSRLQRRYDRLARETGDFTVADPTKVYLRALETGEPMHFAWRVYLPANYNVNLRQSQGSTADFGASSKSSEFIARVRCRLDEQDGLRLYTSFGRGSSAASLGDYSLVELLRDRLDQVRVEQLGAGDIAVVEPDRSAVVLRLTMPDAMRAEAQKKLSPEALRELVPVFFEFELGPKNPKP